MRFARPSPSESASVISTPWLQHRLDALLDLVGELVAVRPEQLDAVVEIRIVRGRDHHADVGAQRAGEHGDRGRRDRPEQEHVHAGGGQARPPWRSRSCSRTAAYPCRARRGGGGCRAGRTGRRPCRPSSPLPPSSEMYWLCHGCRPCRNICRPSLFVPEKHGALAPLARISATERDAPRITFGEFMLRTLRNHCRFVGLVKIGVPTAEQSAATKHSRPARP